MNRRNFLKLTGLAIAGVTVGVPAIKPAVESCYPDWVAVSFRSLPEVISGGEGGYLVPERHINLICKNLTPATAEMEIFYLNYGS